MLAGKKFELKHMLLAILLAGVATVLPMRAFAQSVTLGWQAGTDPSIAGYDIYYGTTSQTYTNEVSVGDVGSATVSGLVPGVTYYFAATSFDAQNQQSAFSPEIVYTVPLPVTSPPTITGMQSTNAALAGQQVNFSVSATGTGSLSYQWMYNQNNLAGQTSANLTLMNVTPAQSGAYSVTVSDSNGSTNSSAANLTVYATTAATLTSTPVGKHQFALNIAGVPNYQYVVQASTDLVNWVPVATNVSPFTFADMNSSQYRQRFYRVAYGNSAAGSQVTDITNNLVAWYPLAGNLNDYSVNANNGVGAGTIAYTTGPANGTHTALAFDGTDTYVAANNTSAFVANSAITLTGWVHPNDMNLNYAGFGLRSPSDGPGAFYINLLANGQYQGRFRNSSGTAVDLGGSFATGSWIFVALTYDGSTLTLYANGVAVASAPASGNFGASNLPLYIGATGYTPTGSLPDYPMAGIRLYNAALSAAALQQLYSNGINSGIF